MNAIPLADHLAEVILDRHENDELADCFELREGGHGYLGRLAARAAFAYFEEKNLVVVEGKTPHKGPRAQVTTISDSVRTREGERLAAELHDSKERLLDAYVEIGQLKRQINRMPGATP